MSNIRVDLESVQVIDGQGAGEGDFELRLQVQEGKHNLIWPGLNSSSRVDQKGAPFTIGLPVATYRVDAGTSSKRFTIDATEVDKGTLGQDDTGQSTLNFDLTPDMAPSTKAVTITLKGGGMGGAEGKVKVVMTAQRA